MKKKDLYILMLEDDPLDAELNKEQLFVLEEYNCIIEVVCNKESYHYALDNSKPDIILCDYNLPDYTGLEALHDLKQRSTLIPFIFVTGAMIEETAADAIKAGAWDYVVKDRLFRLPLAIRSALELKKEKELSAYAEEKANLLLMAIEQTSAQIIVTDKDGNIEYVNKKYSEVTGLSFDEVIGRKADFIMPTDIHNNNRVPDFERLMKGETIRGEVLNKDKNGKEYWEIVSITPIRNSQGIITNFVGVKEDITIRKKMELDIIEARDKAERSDKLKDAFLQNMSHEIRTPLNAIVGFSTLLSEPENIGVKAIIDYTKIINKSSNQLLRIVSDVLTVASIQTGQETIDSKSVDLFELLDSLYEVFLPDAENKKIELRYHRSSKKAPVIITDEFKVKQVLSNLLNNAIKFTHLGYVELGHSIKENQLEFFVKDTGIGIAANYQELIFESFRQVNPSIHIEYGGTGLGLTISKSFAQMLNGSIRVESELQVGSTFYFTIPYVQKETDEHAEKKLVLSLNKTPLHILIAEDEYFNYALLEAFFKDSNVIIYHAKNGLEAYNFCIENPKIDIVLMDIKMPIMDGLKAFKEIKKIRNSLPIIALTAYALDSDRRSLLEMGFSEYIAKPVSHKNIIEKINKTLKTPDK